MWCFLITLLIVLVEIALKEAWVAVGLHQCPDRLLYVVKDVGSGIMKKKLLLQLLLHLTCYIKKSDK